MNSLRNEASSYRPVCKYTDIVPFFYLLMHITGLCQLVLDCWYVTRSQRARVLRVRPETGKKSSDKIYFILIKYNCKLTIRVHFDIGQEF